MFLYWILMTMQFFFYMCCVGCFLALGSFLCIILSVYVFFAHHDNPLVVLFQINLIMLVLVVCIF